MQGEVVREDGWMAGWGSGRWVGVLWLVGGLSGCCCRCRECCRYGLW